MIKGEASKHVMGGNYSLISHMFDKYALLALETSLLIINTNLTEGGDEMMKYIYPDRESVR